MDWATGWPSCWVCSCFGAVGFLSDSIIFSTSWISWKNRLLFTLCIFFSVTCQFGHVMNRLFCADSSSVVFEHERRGGVNVQDVFHVNILISFTKFSCISAVVLFFFLFAPGGCAFTPSFFFFFWWPVQQRAPPPSKRLHRLEKRKVATALHFTIDPVCSLNCFLLFFCPTTRLLITPFLTWEDLNIVVVLPALAQEITHWISTIRLCAFYGMTRLDSHNPSVICFLWHFKYHPCSFKRALLG